ncbi:MAG: ABC transporter permease [Sedimentisphaerales bacterium]|nr:ABC transporter permease [Sedimentisphaerales bacterium]
MTTNPKSLTSAAFDAADRSAPPHSRAWRRFQRNRAAIVSLIILTLIVLTCVVTIGHSATQYQSQNLDYNRHAPQLKVDFAPFGYDTLGRNMLWRCLFGGLVSLGIGLAAAAIAVVIGTTWGAVAGWCGGRTDNLMMRFVDILYGLPYILLVILLKVAFEPILIDYLNATLGPGSERIANVVILFLAIGSVSWLTMARVIRGQVLSIKTQPFVEAARAAGLPTRRILLRHILPNLIGPIIVYATLTVPQAILQESFLSFLGIGVQAPLPSWGSLASQGVQAVNTVSSFWWLLLYPCGLLALTLLCLNFIGDGLRDALDPRGQK